MSYFSNFPRRINYPITFVDRDNIFDSTVNFNFPDFYRQVALIYPKINDALFYYQKATIRDGERPEQLSFRLYGDTRYYWTFFIINDSLRLGEMLQWPLSQYQLQEKIAADYNGLCCTTYNSEYIPEKYLFNKFIVGEEVVGNQTNIRAKLRYFRPELGQIILTDVESIDLEFFETGETLTGQESGDSITIDLCVEWKDSIYKYYETTTGRECNNPNFLDTQIYSGISNVTLQQHILMENERMTNIRVLKKSSVREFDRTVRELISK